MELDDLPKEKLKELIHEVTDDVEDDENLDYGDENLVDDDANLDVVLRLWWWRCSTNLSLEELLMSSFIRWFWARISGPPVPPFPNFI